MMSILRSAKFIHLLGLCLILLGFIPAFAQPQPAIENTQAYLPLLQGKNIAVVANQTSMKGEVHLVDFLISQDIAVKKVFAPEHGFRGNADAGAHVKDGVDSKTGLPIISLYGKNKKPSAAQLSGLDLVVFDIQDVGVRFYTYISTMTLVMEACAESNIPVLILDRPNPNGFYVDGPVLQKGFESFVGMHQVPVVYGMTMAEYACMVNEEGWLANGIKCDVDYVLNSNYTHKSRYVLPVKPSPNLPNSLSVYLYPSLCFFEGTPVSAGRGTDYPFQQFGAPWLKMYAYKFTPQANEGAQHPKFKGQECYGVLFTEESLAATKGKIELKWLMDVYENSPNQETFFTSFFKLLAGTDQLQKDIESGKSQEDIKSSWQPQLKAFKEVRKKYLLYPDFE